PQEESPDNRGMPDVASAGAKRGQNGLAAEVVRWRRRPSPRDHHENPEEEGDRIHGKDRARADARNEKARDCGADRTCYVLMETAERGGRRKVFGGHELGNDRLPRGGNERRARSLEERQGQ